MKIVSLVASDTSTYFFDATLMSQLGENLITQISSQYNRKHIGGRANR